MADMKPFVAIAREVYEYSAIVWAEDDKDAVKRMKEAYNNGDIEFDFDNLVNTEFICNPVEHMSEARYANSLVLNPDDCPGVEDEESND